MKVSPILSKFARALIALVAALPICLPGGHAIAQGSVQLLVRGCDLSRYPTVTCQVVVIEPSGAPVTGLSADTFSITDDTGSVPITSVNEDQDAQAGTSTLLLLDLSGSLSGSTAALLRSSTEEALKGKPINEEVALIALTAQIDMPASVDLIPLDPQFESDFSRDANEAVINKVRPLKAARGTPLHDGLSKAILMARKRQFGARAIVVMTDGFDTRSTAANIELIIDTARKEGIPIYTFGFGNARDEAKLKNLSVSTGGEYFRATDPGVVANAYRALQAKLKTSYAIKFTLPNATNAERKIAFKADLSNTVVAPVEYVIKPEPPLIPLLAGVRLLSNSTEVLTQSVPLETIVVNPVIFAQQISRVEYQLDDGAQVVRDQQPYSFEIDAKSLEPGSKHRLSVVVFGAADKPEDKSPPTVIEFTVADAQAAVQPEPTVAPVATVEIVATPVPDSPWWQTFTDNPPFLIALLVGLIALLVLLGLIMSTVLKRRSYVAGPVTDVIASPYVSETGFSTGSDTSYDTSSVNSTQKAASMPPVREDITRVILPDELAAAANESPKTQVLRVAIAVLDVLSGPTKGERLPVGMPGKLVILVGRDADPAAGDLKLGSLYVSRRHAEISVESDGSMRLKDLGSASGTKLNGERMQPQETRKLELGMEILFADVQVGVRSIDSAPSTGL